MASGSGSRCSASDPTQPPGTSFVFLQSGRSANDEAWLCTVPCGGITHRPPGASMRMTALSGNETLRPIRPTNYSGRPSYIEDTADKKSAIVPRPRIDEVRARALRDDHARATVKLDHRPRDHRGGRAVRARVAGRPRRHSLRQLRRDSTPALFTGYGWRGRRAGTAPTPTLPPVVLHSGPHPASPRHPGRHRGDHRMAAAPRRQRDLAPRGRLHSPSTASHPSQRPSTARRLT